MAVLNERENINIQLRPGYQRNYFFSSFFFTKYMELGYDGIKRWGRNIATPNTIFEGRYVFFPINQENSHWVLVVADVPNRQLRYFDSQQGNGAEYYCNLNSQSLL